MDAKADALREETSATGPAQAGSAMKNVLLLFSGRFSAPLSMQVDEAVRQTFERSPSVKVELYTETLDVARFDPERYGSLQAAYLREKFAERKPDLIITSLPQATRFVLKFRNELFPDTPIISCLADESELAGLTPAPNFTGVPITVPWKDTLELALALHPGTRNVVVVAGSDNLAQVYLRQTKLAFQPYEDRLALIYLTDRTLPQLLKEVAGLLPHSVIIFTEFSRDAADQVYISAEVSGQVANAADAPVYGISSTFFGRGIVGGHIVDYRAHATRAAEIGLRMLAGEKLEAIAAGDVQSPPRFDARQLKRWNIAESSLPQGSIVLYKEPFFWERHRLLILISTVCLLEATLILLLLAQRRRRKIAEESFRKSEEKYRSIFEGALEGIYQTSPEGRNLTANPALAKMLGYDCPAEVMSLITDLGNQAWVDPNQRLDYIRRLDESGFILNYECELYRKDKTRIWASLNARRVVGAAGGTLYYSGFIEDITERKKVEDALKRSEERYRALVQTSCRLGMGGRCKCELHLCRSQSRKNPGLRTGGGHRAHPFSVNA